jgi:hypothetical protein
MRTPLATSAWGWLINILRVARINLVFSSFSVQRCEVYMCNPQYGNFTMKQHVNDQSKFGNWGKISVQLATQSLVLCMFSTFDLIFWGISSLGGSCILPQSNHKQVDSKLVSVKSALHQSPVLVLACSESHTQERDLIITHMYTDVISGTDLVIISMLLHTGIERCYFRHWSCNYIDAITYRHRA